MSKMIRAMDKDLIMLYNSFDRYWRKKSKLCCAGDKKVGKDINFV